MWLIFVKEMGIVRFLMKMHPKEGILSETSLGLSSWVYPTLQSFAHQNAFLLNCEKEDYPCNLTLPNVS